MSFGRGFRQSFSAPILAPIRAESQALGATPAFSLYEGSDPLGFVISLNLKRRHMTESQRAMVALSLANIQLGQFAGNQHKPSANLQTPQVSQSQAADMLQVSPRSVATAAKVEREAPAEVAEAVKSGAMSLNLAAQVAELPKEDQAQVSGPGAARLAGVQPLIYENALVGAADVAADIAF